MSRSVVQTVRILPTTGGLVVQAAPGGPQHPLRFDGVVAGVITMLRFIARAGVTLYHTVQ